MPVIGLNGEDLAFVRDSPSIAIDPNDNGWTILLDHVNHEVDFTTNLVFQPDGGIPIILVSQGWSIRSVQNYVGPDLTTLSPADAWGAVYTNRANWQGTTTQTVGTKGNVPSILTWTFNDNTLTPTVTVRAYRSDPGLTPIYPNAPASVQGGYGASPGSPWTYTGGSGYDTWSRYVGYGSIDGTAPADPVAATLTSFEPDDGLVPSAIAQTLQDFGQGLYTLSFTAALDRFGSSSPLDLYGDGTLVGQYDLTSTITTYQQSFNFSEGPHAIRFSLEDPSSGGSTILLGGIDFS